MDKRIIIHCESRANAVNGSFDSTLMMHIPFIFALSHMKKTHISVYSPSFISILFILTAIEFYATYVTSTSETIYYCLHIPSYAWQVVKVESGISADTAEDRKGGCVL